MEEHIKSEHNIQNIQGVSTLMNMSAENQVEEWAVPAGSPTNSTISYQPNITDEITEEVQHSSMMKVISEQHIYCCTPNDPQFNEKFWCNSCSMKSYNCRYHRNRHETKCFKKDMPKLSKSTEKSNSLFGVRYRCPTCPLEDNINNEKRIVISNHIMDFHQGFSL